MADTKQQLSKLLGREVKQLRVTDEDPPRISVIDVAVMITGHGPDYASQAIRNISENYPDVRGIITDLKFRGRGQRNTPVTDVRGIVNFILLLPGRQAARVRRQAAELLCRYLGGDLALIDEVCAIRGFQEQLAARAPEDQRRLFGEAVEASSSSLDPPLAQVLSNMNERLTKQEQMLARIHESLEHDRQRVNLNVRAPKRAAPHKPQIARDIAGLRPFPVAKFLDQKEREDPTWKCARRSFAPTFGMQVQVLKKNKLREEGKAAVYVEQNSRPQLLYTDEDRELMQAAWEMTTAHREDLAGRPGRAAPIVQDSPSVMDMLRR